jgi:hypothetical protein
MGMRVTCMENIRNVYKFLIGKAEARRPLGKRIVDGRVLQN